MWWPLAHRPHQVRRPPRPQVHRLSRGPEAGRMLPGQVEESAASAGLRRARHQSKMRSGDTPAEPAQHCLGRPFQGSRTALSLAAGCVSHDPRRWGNSTACKRGSAAYSPCFLRSNRCPSAVPSFLSLAVPMRCIGSCLSAAGPGRHDTIPAGRDPIKLSYEASSDLTSSEHGGTRYCYSDYFIAVLTVAHTCCDTEATHAVQS